MHSMGDAQYTNEHDVGSHNTASGALSLQQQARLILCAKCELHAGTRYAANVARRALQAGPTSSVKDLSSS